jgi:hypothetical protein
MHHLHREVAAALLRERHPDVATAVEDAFVERVLALGGRFQELWNGVVKGTASAEEQRLSWLLAPAGARLPCFHEAQGGRFQKTIAVLSVKSCMGLHVHSRSHPPVHRHHHCHRGGQHCRDDSC